jgi:hypothetical protein
MADAINTGNPVNTTKFMWNKYDDIDGSRVNQDTPRGRLGFRDTNNKFTLPRTLAEARKAVFALDHGKPLNPPPYFDGPGLNGATLYPWGDGSLGNQETGFTMDPNVSLNSGWPAAIKQYDVPQLFYDLPVTSGNKCYTGDPGTYGYGALVYTDYTTGNEGKLTVSGAAAGNLAVGTVVGRDIFGPNTITVKLRGRDALA